MKRVVAHFSAFDKKRQIIFTGYTRHAEIAFLISEILYTLFKKCDENKSSVFANSLLTT